MADAVPDYHLDEPLFRDAIRYTAAETGFSERLLEKDYFCTLALAYLDAAPVALVFKGGTCLSKVHAGFFRLSEDLDFGLSTPLGVSRKQRRGQIEPLKGFLASRDERTGVLSLAQPLRGFNDSTQYAGRLAYRSVVTGQPDALKIEVSVREPIVEPAARLGAKTALLDPFRNVAATGAVAVRCLGLREAYAEKLRAALTRHEPAIRDFFDLSQANAAGLIDPADPGLLRLLKHKLAVPGNPPVDLSPEKRERLRSQLSTNLRPVLREDDFHAFDLDRALGQAAEVAQRLRSP